MREHYRKTVRYNLKKNINNIGEPLIEFQKIWDARKINEMCMHVDLKIRVQDNSPRVNSPADYSPKNVFFFKY